MKIFYEEIEYPEDFEYDEFDKVDSMIDDLKEFQEENINNLEEILKIN